MLCPTTSAKKLPMHQDHAQQPAIVIYSSALCGYCMMAKRLLSDKGIQFDERSVDGQPAVRTEMQQRSGRTSVPQIFVGERHIGGCDDLYRLERDGSLDELLARDEAQ